jgi:hypothetical protein
MEIYVARYFCPRVNLIVPNISWGMFNHECDLLVLTKSGYAYEIEIKVSRSDLRADAEKKHGHVSKKIKKLYFAIPDTLADCVDLIPEHAGIIVVGPTGRCKVTREARVNSSHKFSDAEMFAFARLGTLRIWPMKEKILGLRRQHRYMLESLMAVTR